MASQSRAQEKDGERRTGGFAETHGEIQQRMDTELAKKHSMPRLGRDMCSAAMIKETGIEARERQYRRRRHEPIETAVLLVLAARFA